MKTSTFLISLAALLCMVTVNAQHRHQHHARPAHAKPIHVIHKKCAAGPIAVYHPHWHGAATFHQRWIYFPGPAIYRDNKNSVFFCRNGHRWVREPWHPRRRVRLGLHLQTHIELPEQNNDCDDVYKSNDEHRKQAGSNRKGS